MFYLLVHLLRCPHPIYDAASCDTHPRKQQVAAPAVGCYQESSIPRNKPKKYGENVYDENYKTFFKVI